jgi:hypothetical protein
VGQGGCSDDSSGYYCVAGSWYQAFYCAPDEYCLVGPAGPACGVPECLLGQSQCGDPSDPSYPEAEGFSRCDLRADGIIGWVLTECFAPTRCVLDPSSGALCDSDCLPGDQRCDLSETGIQTCGAEGTWGATVPCSAPGEAQLFCLVPPTAPHAPVCADPACYLIQANGITGEAGVCEGGRLHPCGSDGRVSAGAAQDCSIGLCLEDNEPLGQPFGHCQMDCEPGGQRCVASSYEIQTCTASGTWELVPVACPDGEFCYDQLDAAGLQRAICGECTPGDGWCDTSTTMRVCDANGHLGATTPCARGWCNDVWSNELGINVTFCRDECVPGSLVCMGSFKMASDGTHSGSSAYGTCTAEARSPMTSTNCLGTATCRESSPGEVLGCVECVGPSVPGGNEDGLADSRCATAGEAVETCTAANDWLGMAGDCPLSSVCYQESATGNAYCAPL